MKKMLLLFLSMLFFFCSPLQAQTTATTKDAPITCKVAATDAIYPCSIGKHGVRVNKKEGDYATPAGRFLIREVFYRADKLSVDEINQLKKMQDRGFSVNALTQDDGWVDDVKSPYYNQFVKISTLKNKSTSYENLWRDDGSYDIIVVVGYNDDPVVKGKGSAIFMHVARLFRSGKYKPTQGCIAFSKSDLLKILAAITPKTYIDISAKEVFFHPLS